MRLSFLLLIPSVVTTGCTLYDTALLEESLVEQTVNGDGDDSADGDDDPVTGDGDTGGTPVSGDGDDSGDGDGDGDDSGDGDTSGDGDGDGDTSGDGDNAGGAGPVEGDVESLVEDFSAPAAFINTMDGRFGNWAVWTDGSNGGVMSPGPGEPFETTVREDDALNQALHVTCTGFSIYGCGAYAMLNRPVDPGAYDLDSRGYDAIRFDAKLGDTADAYNQLQVALGDEMSTLEPYGTCASPCSDPDKPTAITLIDEEWAEITLPLTAFTRRNSPNPLDTSKVFELQLAMDSDNVDFWIDNIRFVETAID